MTSVSDRSGRPRSGRPAEAVVGSRDRNQGRVGGRVVFGVEAVYCDRSIQSHLEPQVMSPGHVPVGGHGGPDDQDRSAPVFGPGRETPEPESDGGSHVTTREVTFRRDGHRDFTKGDGAESQFRAPVVPAVFAHDSNQAGTSDGDAQPKLSPVPGLCVDRPGRDERRQKRQEDRYVRVHLGGGERTESEGAVDMHRNRKVTSGSLSSTAGRSMKAGGLALVSLGFAVLVGCEPPDRPPTLDPGLPAEAREYLAPDRTRIFSIAPGVIYREVRSGRQPWTVHLIDIDLTRCEIGFQVAATRDDPGRVTVSDLARRSGPGVLAAVNGDFFTPEDLPLGLEASGGELRGRSSRPVFAWRPGADPWIGPTEWDGDSLRLGGWTLSGDGASSDGAEIVGGYPAILLEGDWVGDLLQQDRPAFASARHPRTAVGYDSTGRRLWLVVADGRREGLAEGMSLPELAGLLSALGVTEALNLDGGGSSVMVALGVTVNRPSDPQGERSVVNALLVRQDTKYCVSRRSGDPDPEPSEEDPMSNEETTGP